MLPPCKRKSLVYENVCSICNEGAGSKKELEKVDPLIPSIYVGETSRTVQERALEHWADTRGSSKGVEGSHVLKHMEQYHGGRRPEFIMRVVEFHKSALSRQTGEAVRIMRRGEQGVYSTPEVNLIVVIFPDYVWRSRTKLRSLKDGSKRKTEQFKRL